MVKLKTGILVMLVGIAILGMTVSSVGATNNCGAYVSSCTKACTSNGQCGSGEYSGTQTGCKNGDPRVSTSWMLDVDLYLKTKGYSQTWVESSYDKYDYTKRVDSDGDCRWQARRTLDNHYVYYKDGPEPNPQPRFFGNGNADLWNPFGCERNTIQAWHDKC